MIKNILIADDAKTARMIIKKCLQIIGYDNAVFFEAENGDEALKSLKQNPVDLMVTDINMPVMDGIQLLRRVKASPKLTTIPILVITSTSNPALEKQIIELGAFSVLNKPVNPSTLAKVLEDLLESESGWGV